MKHILLISYHFFPDSAVGGLRPRTFAKYLTEYGWQAIILTVKEKYYGVPDLTGSENHEKVRVVRTSMIRSPSFYYRRVKRMTSLGPNHRNKAGYPAAWRRPKTDYSVKGLLSWMCSLPDEKAGWLPFAVMRGIELIHRENIKVLMTTGPPHSVHLIGAWLSILTRVPWVADFRDPYLDCVLETQGERRWALPLKVATMLEGWMTSKAAFILTTTDRLAERLRSRYPLHKQKILALPNGYDPDDFKGMSSRKERCFTISYLGTLYEFRDPELILRCISELIQEGHMHREGVAVRFVGNCNEAGGKAIRKLTTKYGLAGIVEERPWSPRSQTLEMMMRSHVLLLLAEDQPLAIPGKLYEYIGSGSTILAITGDGATADMLRELGKGIIVRPGDYESLKARVVELYQQYLSGCEQNHEQPYRGTSQSMRCDRRYQTGQLATVLDEASQGRGQG